MGMQKSQQHPFHPIALFNHLKTHPWRWVCFTILSYFVLTVPWMDNHEKVFSHSMPTQTLALKDIFQDTRRWPNRAPIKGNVHENGPVISYYGLANQQLKEQGLTAMISNQPFDPDSFQAFSPDTKAYINGQLLVTTRSVISKFFNNSRDHSHSIIVEIDDNAYYVAGFALSHHLKQQIRSSSCFHPDWDIVNFLMGTEDNNNILL